jgi:hypothetical protein
MKYAVQIMVKENSPWVPGIHRFGTKRAAKDFAQRVNKHNSSVAHVVRQRKNSIEWEAIS